ncbi:MAG: hypothetical protein JHC38_06450, partial [Thiotrichales bacterium]|nr:hypothetical protein [Thiotrichales bacterium]
MLIHTWSFTSGLDNYVGTANADSVSGAIADISATDTVVGGAKTATTDTNGVTTYHDTAATADTLTLTTAGTLSFAAGGAAAGVSGFEKLVLANGTNTITLGTPIEDSAAAALTNGNWSTITGGTGYDTVVVKGTSTANMTTVTGIEQFTLADDGSSSSSATEVGLTFTGAATSAIILGQDVDAAHAITLGNFKNSITL